MASNHPHHHQPNQSPPTKRTRLGTIPTATSSNNDWFETTWSHFHAFMDDDDGDDDDNNNNNVESRNWQALEDLIVLAEPHVNARVSNMLPVSQLTTRQRLVPVLVSVASHLLAEHSMTMMMQQQPPPPPPQQQDKSNADIITTHLQRAVTLFSKNAAAWALGAQYLCMMMTTTTQQHSSCASTIAAWCEHACRLAQKVKLEANLVLEQEESLPLAGRVLLELLLMNQVVGVELNEQENEEDEDELEEDDDDDEEEEDFWTASTVESKARYLAALMRSAMGDHDKAVQHLQQFWPNLTHRLHPDVWTTTDTTNATNNATTTTVDQQQQQQQQQQQEPVTTNATITLVNDSSTFQWEPTVVSGRPGVLPVELHQRLCRLFASPDAAYWKDSRQQQQGRHGRHFSFFVPLQQTTQQHPTNVVEHAVCHYVLPLVQQKLLSIQSNSTTQPICGFDWWVDHPQLTGRRLDFHKVLLPAEQTVAVPVVSSVLFLHGNHVAAVVLDQTPDDSSELAATAWRCPAVENTMFMFAGNLLHGIIPQCKEKDTGTTKKKNRNNSGKPAVQDLFQKPDPALACLTLHVGFWTRPISGQKAYTPCGPLPLATNGTNTWAKVMSEGYPVNNNLKQDPPSPPTMENTVICDTVPRITPAWQEIAAPSKRRKPPLEVPPNMDQRFFLNYEPGCFQVFLFDNDDSGGSCQGDDEEVKEDEL